MMPFHAMAIESVKLKHPWGTRLVASALIALCMASAISQYLRYAQEFRAQGLDWLSLWSQGSLLWSVVFLPMLITLRAAVLTRMEHENGNWRRLASYGVSVQVLRGKLAILAVFVLGCQAGHLLAVLLAGLSLGFPFDAGRFAEFALWELLGALGGYGIAVVQLAIGMWVPSFATVVSIGMVGALGALGVQLAVPALRPLYPYGQIEQGMRVRDVSGFDASQWVMFLAVNLLLIAVGFAAARFALARKEY